MLEANAHNHLKNLYQKNLSLWPHTLTLTRLIARSLRRRDNTLIQLSSDCRNHWWPGLLIPICLESNNIVLVVSSKLRRQIIEVELPNLEASGLHLEYVEGMRCSPPENKIWLLNHENLSTAYENDSLKNCQLIIPEAEFLSSELTKAMSIKITTKDWDHLIKFHPRFESSIINIHERLSRRLFSQAACHDAAVMLDSSEIQILRDTLKDEEPSPIPWNRAFRTATHDWVDWAQLSNQSLKWDWYFQPLTPLKTLSDLWCNQAHIMLTNSGKNDSLLSELKQSKCSFSVEVDLGNTFNQEPISLFVPKKQPLPNTPSFYRHVLDQCRRLILGRRRITIILVDDLQLRLQLLSELAGEFGLRVVHETTDFESNGIICCSCDWWIINQHQLPMPDQLIFAIIPFPTLESPLIAARAQIFKKQGRDWFREFLLPEALSILLKSIAMIRGEDVRVAILDGRMRYRSWGKIIFQTLEPWILLEHLLPY